MFHSVYSKDVPIMSVPGRGEVDLLLKGDLATINTDLNCVFANKISILCPSGAICRTVMSALGGARELLSL